MGSKIGVLKVAAKRLGIPLDEYMEHIEKSEKHCGQCRQWKLLDEFHIDNSRGDGRASICIDCRKVKNPYASLRGRVSTFKGKKHTEEAKRKMSNAKKGMKLRLGKKHTLETRKKISRIARQRTPRGKDAPGYIDGKGIERRGLRYSDTYKRWRYDVYFRDNFTCQKCGDSKGGNLHAHHSKPFSTHPHLRLEVSNGITLCEECHIKEHRQ